jgi:hypothetical protein
MKKSTPPSVKHKNCEVKYVPGPFGPHKGKFVCAKHKNAFVMWAPKNYQEN